MNFNIKANTKNIVLKEENVVVEGISGTPIKFAFEEYIDAQGSKLDDLEAFAIYDAKNAFLNQYDLTKYANRLYKDGHYQMARANIDYFKTLAQTSKHHDKQRSYRLLVNKNELFVRGITSVNQYNEYGVDFAFIVTMLLFHRLMEKNPGNHYAIGNAAVSASAIELIVTDKNMKDAKGFGEISSSTIVSTNDLSNASFKFLNIIKVGVQNSRGVYVFPKAKTDYKNELIITHNTKPENALALVKSAEAIIRSSDEFIKELESVKQISSPDELRIRILNKLQNPNSPFRVIQSVRDIFKPAITNSIENFANLLEMCRKAEELDIDYDLKDKLRYIISDIILNKK